MRHLALLRNAALPVLAAALLTGVAAPHAAADDADGRRGGGGDCSNGCPAGEPGPAGPPGPPGPAGPTLPTQIVQTTYTLAPGLNTGTATCPDDTAITGGGLKTPLGGNNLTVQVYESYPSAGDTWTVSFNNPAGTTGSYVVYAVCQPVS